MIKAYLISIVVWAFMIFAVCYIFEDRIKENGWLDAPKSKKNPFLMLLFMSAVPVLRVVFLLTAICMACFTQEQLDEWKRDQDDESN